MSSKKLNFFSQNFVGTGNTLLYRKSYPDFTKMMGYEFKQIRIRNTAFHLGLISILNSYGRLASFHVSWTILAIPKFFGQYVFLLCYCCFTVADVFYTVSEGPARYFYGFTVYLYRVS